MLDMNRLKSMSAARGKMPLQTSGRNKLDCIFGNTHGPLGGCVAMRNISSDLVGIVPTIVQHMDGLLKKPPGLI
jgi:hypothetical protein